jgi:hypothetical protein
MPKVIAGDAPHTVQLYVCGRCREVINPPENGLCVHGNIYVADPVSKGGLIGNNIDAGPDGRITDVRKTVLCRLCFEAVCCRATATVAGDVASLAVPKTVQFYACGGCRKVINRPEDGFCVHGNIYVADPVSIGGLIGNNIDAGPDGIEVRETVLCRPCFGEAVRCDPRPSRADAAEGNP